LTWACYWGVWALEERERRLLLFLDLEDLVRCVLVFLALLPREFCTRGTFTLGALRLDLLLDLLDFFRLTVFFYGIITLLVGAATGVSSSSTPIKVTSS